MKSRFVGLCTRRIYLYHWAAADAAAATSVVLLSTCFAVFSLSHSVCSCVFTFFLFFDFMCYPFRLFFGSFAFCWLTDLWMHHTMVMLALKNSFSDALYPLYWHQLNRINRYIKAEKHYAHLISLYIFGVSITSAIGNQLDHFLYTFPLSMWKARSE